MTENILVEILKTQPFAIVMSLALFWYMIKQNESHKEEMLSLKDAVSSLEIAITKLVERLSMNEESDNNV